LRPALQEARFRGLSEMTELMFPANARERQMPKAKM